MHSIIWFLKPIPGCHNKTIRLISLMTWLLSYLYRTQNKGTFYAYFTLLKILHDDLYFSVISRKSKKADGILKRYRTRRMRPSSNTPPPHDLEPPMWRTHTTSSWPHVPGSDTTCWIMCIRWVYNIMTL